MSETLDDYRLIGKLGEGAAGEVYLATPSKEKPFAKPGELLAVKRYKPEILSQVNQFARIEREFTVGSQLAHPNLVRIFDWSGIEQSDSTPYVVMEYVDGFPLDVWLEQFHPPSRTLMLRFAEQLLDAVQCLHDEKIQHRDIKPSNIMVTRTFDVKIMDFGVVRITKDTQVTPGDKFLGTIRNSSPEMLFGRDYDIRNDLYSVGTVFYALLHGEEVFAEETQFACLTRLIDTEDPVLDPATKRDDVSRVLFDITQKLLQKEPDARPNAATDILDELTPLRTAAGDPGDFLPLHGYVATALTGLDDDSRESIMFASSKIAELAKERDLYVYQPRKSSDPVLHPDVAPTAVYALDYKRVVSADVLFVLANQPSFGVGQEIEIATAYGVPTIVLAREGTRISRMVTGSPANILDVIYYTSPEDLGKQVRKSLTRNLERVRQWRSLTRVPRTFNVGHRLVEFRRARGYETAEEFAETLGLSPTLLHTLEQGERVSLSLHLLDRVARQLGSSLAELLGTAPAQGAATPLPIDANLRRLESVAKRLSWSAADFLALRDDYHRQFAASGDSTTLRDEEWVSRHNKLEERRLRESEQSGSTQTSLF